MDEELEDEGAQARWLAHDATMFLAKTFKERLEKTFNAWRGISSGSTDPKVTAIYTEWANVEAQYRLFTKGYKK